MSTVRYVAGENVFEKFKEKRESLIVMLKNGDISKTEYIEESYYYICDHGVKPFKIVDNFNKAVFNYQYYNMMAKYSKLKAKEIEYYGKHERLGREHRGRVNDYYHQKNRMVLKAVELLDFQGVEAYFIKVRSQNLKEKLFEVVFHEHPSVVFHSKGEWLRKRLEEEGIFQPVRKNSIIESYVNERY